jgi:hypothetical protein
VVEVPRGERDALVEHLRRRGFEVRRRQVQEVDPDRAKPLLVIAILKPKVDDRAYPMAFGELAGALHRKAPADRQALGQPVKIRLPRGHFGR